MEINGFEDYSIDMESIDKLDLDDSTFKLDKSLNEELADLDRELAKDKMGIEDSMFSLKNEELSVDMENDITRESIRKIHEYLDNDKIEDELFLKRLKRIEENLDNIIIKYKLCR